MIELREVTAGYRGVPVVSGVTLELRPGRVLVLAGPNGCGKSTLLRTALGLQPKLGGQILYGGADLERLTPRQVARQASFLPQSRAVPNITAGRMVLHGRFARLTSPRRYRREDRDAALRALEWVGAAELKDRPMGELSGGQRQKVYLAMALAQDTETILMDEPTTFLDARRQLETMALARRMAEEGRAVVMVLHDLCLALRAADAVAVLGGRPGRLLACAPPEDLYRSGLLERVFGVSLGRAGTDAGPRYFYNQIT